MKKLLAMLVLLLVLGSSVAQTDKPPLVKKDAPGVDRYGDPLPDGAIARLGTMRFRHGFTAQRIAYAPGGKVLASAGRWPGLCLWEADSGRLLHRYEIPFAAYGLAFSPDGSKLFTGAKLIDVATGKEIPGFKAPEAGFGATYSPDGATVATSIFAGGKHKIVLWDAMTGVERQSLTGHRDSVRGLVFSPKDSKILASASEDKSVRLWNTATGDELHRLEGHNASIITVAFAPNGKVLASAGEDGVVRLWEVATGKPLHQIKPGIKEISCITFSPDGKLLACTGSGSKITLWNPETGREVRQWQTGDNYTQSVAFASDGKTLAATSPGTIRLWNFETGEEIRFDTDHHGWVYSLRYAATGRSLLSFTGDQRITDWDLTSNQNCGRLFREKVERPGAMFFRRSADISPDGKMLALAPNFRHTDENFKKPPVISLWNTTTGKEVCTLTLPKEFPTSLKFSPNGKRLASGAGDGCRVWDISARKELHHLLGKSGVLALAFAPDGNSLACAGRDNRIHLFNTTTGEELRNWGADSALLCFSDDGKLIAGSNDEVIRIWVAETGKELMQLASKVGPLSLQMSPNGRLFGAGGLVTRTRPGVELDAYSAVQWWELRTGQLIRELKTQQGMVFSLAFDPDGRTIAAGGTDSTVLLLDLTGFGKTKPPPPTAADLDKLWADLAENASKADRAHWTLALSPSQSVPFLVQRLRPPTPADAPQVAKLLIDLESKTLDMRQKAERELIEFGESAEAALRKNLANNPTLELRRRVELILDKRAPEVIRQLRAIDTLEQIGTAETRGMIELLAKGSPNPRVVQAAEAALHRMPKIVR